MALCKMVVEGGGSRLIRDREKDKDRQTQRQIDRDRNAQARNWRASSTRETDIWK